MRVSASGCADRHHSAFLRTHDHLVSGLLDWYSPLSLSLSPLFLYHSSSSASLHLSVRAQLLSFCTINAFLLLLLPIAVSGSTSFCALSSFLHRSVCVACTPHLALFRPVIYFSLVATAVITPVSTLSPTLSPPLSNSLSCAVIAQVFTSLWSRTQISDSTSFYTLEPSLSECVSCPSLSHPLFVSPRYLLLSCRDRCL